MINDINVNGVNLWKYIDDTSMAETVHTGQPSGIQVAIEELVRQAETDKFQLIETKWRVADKFFKICRFFQSSYYQQQTYTGCN